MKTPDNKGPRIETISKQNLSKSYRGLLYIVLTLFAGYNLYLKEFYIAGLMVFIMYMLTYEKKIFFTEKGMDTEYKTLFHHREKHMNYNEIKKVVVLSAPDVVLLNLYTHIFYQKILMPIEEYNKLKKYLNENNIPLTEKKR